MRNNCRRFLILLFGALATLIGLQAETLAGVRLALVLGNGDYQAVGALPNPANDAADVANALRDIGFEVIEGRDSTREAMAKAIRDFSSRLRGADVALFFYAGHGTQMNGENYLLPIDVKIENPADVRFNAINLSDIQHEMEEGGGSRANIIILDACRNNPFLEKLAQSGRAAPARGLGRIEATGQGSLIVYSTQPNNIALDGTGRNSPFSSALLQHITTSGLEVRQMISRVRRDVLQATGQRQTPWDSSSLVGDVYLAGLPAAGPAALARPAALSPAPAQQPAPQPAPAPQVAAVQPAPPPRSIAADQCDDVAAPAPPFATSAQLKKAQIVDWSGAAAACQQAVKDNPNEPRLQFLLGRSFEGTKSYLEAARRYSIAAQADYAPAQSALGVAFMRGEGVIKDKSRAFDLFTRAAATGSGSAMSNLGMMYAAGDFVKKDAAKALALYEKAIEAGNSFALTQAGLTYFFAHDYDASAQYFQQSADLNEGFSLKFLAIMYERGLLGKPDPAKAAELRLQAARVDPESQDPVVKFPPKPQTRRAAPRHRRVIYHYRFFGCSWVWC